MHHDGVRAGKHQAGVPVVEAHHVGRPAFEALDLHNHTTPVPFANGMSVHQEPVSYCSIHITHIGTREAVRKG